jgi:putative endonuclease
LGDARTRLGRRGEEAAWRHIEGLGWKVLARRHRTRLGEIDLIAEEGGTLVFVEVRSRRSRSCGSPEESVTAAKQRRIERLARAFLAGRGIRNRACRFDVIAVEEAPRGEMRLRHLRDAFRP